MLTEFPNRIADVLNPKKPGAKPELTKEAPFQHDAVFEPAGTAATVTATGTNIATPFFADLPCTTKCPVTTRTSAPKPKKTPTRGIPVAGVPNLNVTVIFLIGAAALALCLGRIL